MIRQLICRLRGHRPERRDHFGRGTVIHVTRCTRCGLVLRAASHGGPYPLPR